MIRTAICALSFGLATSVAIAQDDAAIPQDTVDRIMTMLAEANCQMAPEDIEAEEDGGYDLDDVICEGGEQFDITLDADLNETGRRAE